MGYIYKLTFASGKAYVGMTARTLKRRLDMHKAYAGNESYGNRLVYNAWRKHGDPIVEVIAEAPDDQLPALEIRYIAEFGTLTPGGYNLTAGGEATLGYKHTEEGRRKMSLAHIGVPSVLRGRSFPERKKPISDEQKRRISETMKGRTYDRERVEKAAATRRALEAERRSLGITHHRKGTTHSEEARLRIAKANLGRQLSPEHRAALSAGAKAYHAARRATRAKSNVDGSPRV